MIKLRVKQIEDIDMDLLQRLFENRGHGVIHPGFWSQLERVLRNPLMEVHQCACGEIGLVPSWEVARHTINDEWVCKVCGNYDDKTISFVTEKRIDTLLELSSEFVSADEKRRESIWEKIVNLSRGLFPTNNFNEFAFAVDQHQHITSSYGKSDRYWYNAFKQCFLSAEVQDTTNLTALLDYVDVEGANIRLRAFYIKREEVAHIRENGAMRELKLLGSDLTSTPLTAEEPERVMRNLISGYRSLLENTMPLELLANLDLVSSGKSPIPKPFDKLRRKDGGRIRGIFDMVDYIAGLRSFGLYSQGFLRMYETHLRNDDAHEQFVIDLKNEVVFSTKYNETRSFEEITELVSLMYSFHISCITVFNYFLYHSKMKRLGYGGIEDIVFYLDIDEVEASVDVYQYIWFKEASKKNIVDLILKPKDLEMVVVWGGFKIVYKVIPEGLDWLMYAAVKKSFILRIKHIAPSLAYYGTTDSEVIVINDIEFLLQSTIEIQVDLDESFKAFTKHCMDELGSPK